MVEKHKELAERVSAYRDLYQRRKGQEQQLQDELARVAGELEKIVIEQDTLQEIRILLQEASSYAREQARQQVEYMVTQALQYIFGPEIKFEIQVGELRKRPEAEFLVTSTYPDNIQVSTRPQDARGGGVVDIISLALRLALLQCYKPTVAGPVILDEPAKHVSEDYSSKVAAFLKQVSDYFDRQVILVTHNNQLTHCGDKVFVVELRGSKSEVRQMV